MIFHVRKCHLTYIILLNPQSYFLKLVIFVLPSQIKKKLWPKEFK